MGNDKKLITISLLLLFVLVSCKSGAEQTSTPVLIVSTKAASPTIEIRNTSTIEMLDTQTITPATPVVENTPTRTLTPTLSEVQISINEMMEVVKTVEDYYEDHGEYPTSMDDMIPDYLESTPFTHQGYEIMYSPDFHEIYIVYFYPAENRYCSYLKHYDMWECGFFDSGHYNDD